MYAIIHRSDNDNFVIPITNINDSMRLIEMEDLTEEQEKKVIKELDRYNLVEEFENHLNSLYGSVSICGIEYESADILRYCDESEYDSGLDKFSVDYIRIGTGIYSYYLIEDVKALLELD